MNEGKAWMPSMGWLGGFKKRFDISSVKVTGEVLSADVAAAIASLPVILQKLESYSELLSLSSDSD
jgi:hypothetical protein